MACIPDVTPFERLVAINNGLKYYNQEFWLLKYNVFVLRNGTNSIKRARVPLQKTV